MIVFSENKEVLRINLWNEHDLLRLIAVGSVLVNLFKSGLQTYYSKNMEYKQFSKRLGHLLQDTINYVTDVLEEFKLVITFILKSIINSLIFFFPELINLCQPEYKQNMIPSYSVLLVVYMII